MFTANRRKRMMRNPITRKNRQCRPLLEALEARTLMCTNYALNTSGTGFPSSLESDSGWGGGSYPWDMLNGRVSYTDTWAHGLAFTGGRGAYPDAQTPAGLRQATVNLGMSRTLSQVVIWHHGDEHVPATNNPSTTRLEYWNGSGWQPLSYTRVFDVNYTYTGWGSKPDYYTFNAVTGSKVRFTLDNRLNNIFGNQNEHGWIYQFQVLDVPCGGSPLLVTNTNDNGPGSLRAAITYANANAGRDTITFNISGPGVKTINLASPLPNITDPVLIDGYTQPRASANTLSVGNNANLLLELNGAGAAAGTNCMTITAGNTTVKGLVINRCRGNGIELNGGSGNVLEGNFIGTNPAGTAALANGLHGVFLVNGTTNNTIGGTTPGARNLISGNTVSGIQTDGVGVSNNRIQGNYLGTNAAGTTPLGNLMHGVNLRFGPNNTISGNLISGNRNNGIELRYGGGNVVQGNYIGTNASGTAAVSNVNNGVLLASGTTNNIIGGTVAGARNLISGNGSDGVLIADSGTTGNQVQGNFIGTDFSGTRALGNVNNGVSIYQGPVNNLIGGSDHDASVCNRACNLISGNSRYGLLVIGSSTTGNRVQGNYIGINAAGTAALANVNNGVYIADSPNNTIGGTVAGSRNVISGNQQHGVVISGLTATGNVLQGNYIGTTAAGTAPLGNGRHGVYILNAGNNAIGTGEAGAGNLISGNVGNGVRLEGSTSTGNRLQGNYIGTNFSGTARLGNSGSGIHVVGAPSTTIGGTTTLARNLISGNAGAGVQFEAIATTGNRVLGNYIGTDVNGTAALPNVNGGVFLDNARNTTIGGTDHDVGTCNRACNVISGNNLNGVDIRGTSATNNLVQGNFIGTNASGAAAVANVFHGVSLATGAANNTIGGLVLGTRNVISGNGYQGVVITDGGTMGNQIQGNYIGTNAAGTAALRNQRNGVFVLLSARNNLIGGAAVEARNVISGNGENGVLIEGTASTGNVVQGNNIGTNAAGTAALPNASHGVAIVNAPNNSVGGPATGAGNLVSGNYGSGVWLEGEAATGNLIQNNRIGTDVNGDPWGWMPNFTSGVYVMGANYNRIIANEIAFNVNDGVTVFGYGNTITRNRIWDNSDLGIDHYDDGVTLDNVPELYSAWSAGNTTFVQGTLTTLLPYTEYRLEFFVNSDSDPSGYGEGMDYLGTSQVWTDENGLGYFQEGFNRAVPPGYCLSATATDPDGTTWEFSNCVVVDPASGPGGGSSGGGSAGLPWAELLSSPLPTGQPSAEAASVQLWSEVLESAGAAPGLFWQHATGERPVAGLLLKDQGKADIAQALELVMATLCDYLP